MMEFYGIRAYHMVILTYQGGANFYLEIFNECAVEIGYKVESENENPTMLKYVFDDPSETEIDRDKLAATMSFNAMHNFAGLVDVVLSKEDFSPASEYEVNSIST